MHGYARGCRCDECREKHRETQLRYRQTVHAKKESERKAEMAQVMMDHGVSEADARDLAAMFYQMR